MTSRDATRIVTTAKSISFVERSWAELSALLPSETRPGLEILRERIGSGEWDVKRRDALEAIALAEELPTAPVDMPAVVFTGISEHQLLVRRSEHEYMPGRTISDVDVLDAARLFGAVYPDIHERVLRGMLHQFASEEGLDLQTYASNKLGVLGKPVPPPLERWLTRSELVELPFDEQLVRLMTRVWPVWHSMDWRPRVLEDLRSHASWPEWVALVREADDETERSLGKLVQPAPSVRAQLFLRRWRAAGSSPRVEMARRGFLNAADLGRSLGRFFAYDLRSMKN